jgi:hypothetical protein
MYIGNSVKNLAQEKIYDLEHEINLPIYYPSIELVKVSVQFAVSDLSSFGIQFGINLTLKTTL